jgi:rSAM/selenodomain-associated transferase 2
MDQTVRGLPRYPKKGWRKDNGVFQRPKQDSGSPPMDFGKHRYGCSSISVIIPTFNEENFVLAAIRSANQQGGRTEIIVVDGGSTDKTVEVARPHAVVINSWRGRAVQMNTGAGHATGDVFLFLHADSCLPPLALANLEQVIREPQVVGGTFTLRFDHAKWTLRLIAFFSRLKFRYFHYGDQGIFVRRDIFEQLGGFKEIPIMEDLDFLQRLRRKGQVALIKLPVTTSSRRFLENGILRQQLRNIFLVILYLLKTKPEAIARIYERTKDQRMVQ